MKSVFFLMFCLLISTAAHADQSYPKSPSNRLFGTDQGAVGDCQAESETMALETAFATRGLAVRFSLFYRHARNWKDDNVDAPEHANLRLSINDADRAVLNQFGSWIPEYMWPEDTEGLEDRIPTTRPHVAEAAAIDPDYRPIESFGYSQTQRTYQPGYSNTGSLAELQALMRSHAAVTISIHGALLQPSSWAHIRWNSTTGLLETKYTWETLAAASAEAGEPGMTTTAIDHSVALVGYDDSLYADQGYSIPGAFIIRNSWNDKHEVEVSNAPVTDPATQAALASMRFKISSVNLPGYFAIPYQYFIDQFANASQSGYKIMDLDYVGYATQYQMLRDHYQVYNAPFVCDDASIFSDGASARKILMKYAADLAVATDRHAKSTLRIKAREAVKATIQQEANQTGRSVFSIAKITKNVSRGMDRLSEFYAGKFSSYYCSTPASKIWPNISFSTSPAGVQALESLVEDGGDQLGWKNFLEAAAPFAAPTPPPVPRSFSKRASPPPPMRGN